MDEGCDFIWMSRSRAIIVLPSGRRLLCTIRKYVPYLPADGAEAIEHDGDLMVSEVTGYDTDIEDEELVDHQSVDGMRDINASLDRCEVPPRRMARLPRGKALPAISWSAEPGAPNAAASDMDGGCVGPEPPAP